MRSRLGALVDSRSSSGWLIDFTGLWRSQIVCHFLENNVENSIDLDYCRSHYLRTVCGDIPL